MTNIRFPLKKPTSGHPNPYTIEFDFLPYPLTFPLNEADEPYLYTSKITINDTTSESSKIIEHVFPDGKVYFVIDDFYSDINAIATNIFNDSFTGVIRGMWIHLGRIKDIINIKQTLNNASFIPTAIVYNNISISRNTLLQIKEKVNNQLYVNLSPSADSPTSRDEMLLENLKKWLSGKAGILINESEIENSSFILPSVSDNLLQVGALMMNGNGIEFTTLQLLIPIFKRNRNSNNIFNSNNSFLDTDSPLNVGIIPCPVFNFIEKASNNLLIESHRNHPLRLVYPTDPRILEACLFFTNNPYRSRGNIENLTFRPSYRNYFVEIDGVRRDLHPSGLLFSRDFVGRTVELFKNNTPETISLISASNSIVGTLLTINLESKFKNHFRLAIDNIRVEDILLFGNEYFNVEPNFNGLLNFLNQLSIRLNISLTTAECFARALGFIEISTLKYFADSNHKISRNGLEYPVIPGRSTIIYFLAISWAVLTDVSVTAAGGEAEFLNDNFEEYFNELPSDLKSTINNVISHRPFWTNNHGDEENGGWKHFGITYDSGGRKDHFLTNAFAYYDTNIPFIDRVSTLHAFMFYENFLDPDKIDAKYNEKGREFADWLSFNYKSGEVYLKVKELIVEKSYFQ